MKSQPPRDGCVQLNRQRGTTLIEALVAMAVMAFGMLAIAGINGRLRHSGEFAKQRLEASQLARSELESLRGFVAMTREDSTPAQSLVFSEIADATRSVPGVGTTYSVSRSVSAGAGGAKVVTIAVSWSDREAAQSLSYEGVLPAEDPRLIASAYTPPEDGVALRRPLDRHPAIPLRANTLDTRLSVFKPVASGTTAWVFNNLSGMITGICTVSAGSSHASLTLGDVSSCQSNVSGGAYLLRGQVRYALGLTPEPATPNDAIVPVGVAITLGSSVHPLEPVCHTDAADNLAAGINATDYHCLIYPRTATEGDPGLYWSGRSTLTGLTLAAGGHRVCRYSADYDGSGVVENSEHPLDYQRLTSSLAHQNFLVVPFAELCPAGHGVNLDLGQFSNTVTVAHQP